MRVAVVSDIHSNLHALEAVLAAIEAEAPDELWCLGDLVGYGPRPNECCALIAERADVCLGGEPRPSRAGNDRSRGVRRRGGDRGAGGRGKCSIRRRRQLLETPRAAESRPTASSSTTARRATRSGSTSSATRGRARRSSSQTRRSSSSGTATSRCASFSPVSDSTAAWRRPARSSSWTARGRSSTPVPSVSRGTATRAPRTCSWISTRTTRAYRRTEYDIARTQREMRDAELPEMLAARLELGL